MYDKLQDINTIYYILLIININVNVFLKQIINYPKLGSGLKPKLNYLYNKNSF
jgi:hypothetical protein